MFTRLIATSMRIHSNIQCIIRITDDVYVFHPSLASGGPHVRHDCHHIWLLLGTISCLLRVLLPCAIDIIVALHATLVFGLLLVGNGKQHGKSNYLLLDESAIPALFPKNRLLLLCSFGTQANGEQEPNGVLATELVNGSAIEVM